MTRRARSPLSIRLGAALAVIFTMAVASNAGAFAASKPDLVLRKGDRIILIGNTLAERMQYYGHFETLLHARFPELELVVHNLGWSADELTLRPRRRISTTMAIRSRTRSPTCSSRSSASTNRSPAEAGLGKFKNDLEKFIKVSTTTKYNGKEAPRLVLALADRPGRPQEPAHHRRQEEQRKHQALHRCHGRAGRQARRRLRRSIHARPSSLYESSDHPLTINGIHLSDEGYRRLAPKLDRGPFRPSCRDATKADMTPLHAAVQEKNLQFFYDYRAVNGCYIYGGRKAPFGIVNFPAEIGQAAQDDPEPGRTHLGHRPGQERSGDDRRQQHRRFRQGR